MNSWSDKAILEEEQLPRERDSDTSLQAQYEDSVPESREWEHEEDS
jgi:hypothetical protein